MIQHIDNRIFYIFEEKELKAILKLRKIHNREGYVSTKECFSFKNKNSRGCLEMKLKERDTNMKVV